MLKQKAPPHDQSFDNRAEFFKKQIYGTSKGKIRGAVVWRDLEEILARPEMSRHLRILDAGGGFGYIAMKLATLGHDVTLVDISQDMLDLGKRELEEHPVSGSITFIRGEVQKLNEILTDQKFDLVICHAVLEWLVDPKPVIGILKSMLAPDGMLSLMFYNRTALLFQSLVVGNFDYIRQGLVKKRRQKLTPITPLYISEVRRWLAENGFTVSGMSGVRIIHDYMRDKTEQVSKFDDLLSFELEYSRSEDFAHLGRYIHIWTEPLAESESGISENGKEEN